MHVYNIYTHNGDYGDGDNSVRKKKILKLEKKKFVIERKKKYTLAVPADCRRC